MVIEETSKNRRKTEGRTRAGGDLPEEQEVEREKWEARERRLVEQLEEARRHDVDKTATTTVGIRSPFLLSTTTGVH